MINDSPYTIPGVSDGGAHTKFFTGGAYSTDFLAWLVRDEGKITLEEAHYRLSALAAHAAGFQDRGVLREGAAADVLVYDLDELAIDPQWIGEAVHDLPGGEWRRVQRAKGYQQIIVNGEVTFEDGECTGATPGAAAARRTRPDLVTRRTACSPLLALTGTGVATYPADASQRPASRSRPARGRGLTIEPGSSRRAPRPRPMLPRRSASRSARSSRA